MEKSMPICPRCLTEYSYSGVRKCPNCNVKLRAELDLVEAFRVTELHYAEMIKDALKKEGIVASITDNFARSVFEGKMAFLGSKIEVGVMVPIIHLKRALEIYEVFFKDGPSTDDVEYYTCSNCETAVSDDDKVCPSCGEPLEENDE